MRQLRPSRSEAAREILKRRNARKHLLAFTEYTHPRWETGAHHQQICDALEAVERGEVNRLIIEAPPRHTKSELASRRFPAWFIGRNPAKQIITVTYNDDFAKDFGRDVRGIVSGQRYANVFPGVGLSEDTRAAGRWNTSHGGVYVSTGIGGPITGRGAHLALIDDPFKNREDADSAARRETVWKWYTSTIYTRLMPGGAIIVVMTRWHEDDLVGRLLEVDDWTRITLPAIANEGTDDEQALWPQWYPLDTLRDTREMMSKAGRMRDWSALYQQRPSAEQGTYMQREWFEGHLYDEPPKHMNIYMSADFAVTEPRSGADPDYTEFGIFGIGPDDTLYVLDWWSGQTTPDVWIDAALSLIAKWKPLGVFCEGGVIRRSVEPFLNKRARERKVYGRFEWMNPGKDKATRGRAFQARAAMGKVSFPKASPWASRVIDQCVSFPSGTHDDAFDACALMCLAIDDAHAAIVPQGKSSKRDAWRDATGSRTNSWKVV